MGVMTKALRTLMPRGLPWRFPGQAGQMVDGIGASLDRLHSDALLLIDESRPGTALVTLPDWHGALGVPYDATKPIADQRAMLDAMYCAVGGMTRNDLEEQIHKEFPDAYVAEVPTDSECGEGECGVAVCNGAPGDFSGQYFDVTGSVEDDAALMRLGRIIDHFAPAHLEPCIIVNVLALTATSSQCGDGICGLAVAEGENGPIAPVFNSAASISGSGRIGSMMIAYPGAVVGGPTPSVAFQWKKNGSNINGETTPFYTIPADAVAGDVFTCTVTATNASGSASSTSNAVTVLGIAPRITNAQVVLASASTLGAVIACDGYPAPSYLIQWKKNGVDIAGANSVTFDFTGQPGAYSFAVTATNTAGSDYRTSNSISVSAPSISSASAYWIDDYRVGLTMSYTLGYPTGSIYYQWYKKGSAIPGATNSTYYDPTPGGPYYCIVTLLNAVGSASIQSSQAN